MPARWCWSTEIAADTDPTQGAALAQAILERIADSKAHAVVTTHFERLKAVPFSDRRFRNAGVGFESQGAQAEASTGSRSTFRGSSGFDIAQSLGLGSARSWVVPGKSWGAVGELEKVMRELERRSNELEGAREQAEAAARAAEVERVSLVKKRQELEAQIKELRTKAREDLLREGCPPPAKRCASEWRESASKGTRPRT